MRTDAGIPFLLKLIFGKGIRGVTIIASWAFLPGIDSERRLDNFLINKEFTRLKIIPF
jgi:hypothetical protein